MKFHYQTIILLLLICTSLHLTAPVTVSPNQRYINTGVCNFDTSKTYNNSSASGWNPPQFNVTYQTSFGSISGKYVILSIKDLYVGFSNRAIFFYPNVSYAGNTYFLLKVYSNMVNSFLSLSYSYVVIVNAYYSSSNIQSYPIITQLAANISSSAPKAVRYSNDALNLTGGTDFLAGFTGFDVLANSSTNILDLSVSGVYNNPTNSTIFTLNLTSKSSVPIYVGWIFVYVLAYNRGYYSDPYFASFSSYSLTMQNPSYTFVNTSYLYQATTFVFWNSVSIQGSSFLNFNTLFNSPNSITFTTSNSNSTFMFTSINMLTYYCSYTTPYYSSSDSICYDVCPIGTYSDLYTLSCLSCSYDCYTCNNNRTCLACNPIVHHRILNTSTSRCVPMQGYYQTNATVCGSCAAGCAYCSSDKVCTNCTLGYYLNASACVSCPVNCTSCSSANLCAICASGYFFNGSACPSCSANCGSCSSNSSCKNCTQGYYLSSNGSCQSCLLNCVFCVSSSSCQYCNPGYYLSNISTCESCPSNCNSCSSSTSCQFCALGYFVSNTSSCQGCSTNCVTCFSADLCQRCAVGYYLGTTSACSACPADCPSCSSGQDCHHSNSRKIWLLAGVSAVIFVLFIVTLKIIHNKFKAIKSDDQGPQSCKELSNNEPEGLGYSQTNYQTNLASTSINLTPIKKYSALTQSPPTIRRGMPSVLPTESIIQQRAEWQISTSQTNFGYQLCVFCGQDGTFLQLACGHFYHIKCIAGWSEKGNCCEACWQRFINKEHRLYCRLCKLKEKIVPFREIYKLYKENLKEKNILCQTCVGKSS